MFVSQINHKPAENEGKVKQLAWAGWNPLSIIHVQVVEIKFEPFRYDLEYR